MEHFRGALHYVGDHPSIVITAVLAVLVVFYLLNRKPRMRREADERLDQLRKERGDYYRNLRPPR